MITKDELNIIGQEYFIRAKKYASEMSRLNDNILDWGKLRELSGKINNIIKRRERLVADYEKEEDESQESN